MTRSGVPGGVGAGLVGDEADAFAAHGGEAVIAQGVDAQAHLGPRGERQQAGQQATQGGDTRGWHGWYWGCVGRPAQAIIAGQDLCDAITGAFVLIPTPPAEERFCLAKPLFSETPVMKKSAAGLPYLLEHMIEPSGKSRDALVFKSVDGIWSKSVVLLGSLSIPIKSFALVDGNADAFLVTATQSVLST